MPFSQFSKARNTASQFSKKLLESDEAKQLQTSIATIVFAGKIILDFGTAQIKESDIAARISNLELTLAQRLSLSAFVSGTSDKLEHVETYAKNLGDHIKDAAPEVRQKCFDQLLKTTKAFDAYTDNVEVILKRLAFYVEFPDDQYEALKQKHGLSSQPDSAEKQQQADRRAMEQDPYATMNPYELLGVTKTTPLSDVRKKYRAEIQKTHPDRLASQGLSELALKRAEQKTSALNRAMETLKKQHMQNKTRPSF